MTKEKEVPMAALTVSDDGELVICWSFNNGYAEIVLPKDENLEWFVRQDRSSEDAKSFGSDSGPLDYEWFIEKLNSFTFKD